MNKLLLTFFISLFAFNLFSQSVQRISIAAITPSENTGQDYSPWLNDNLDSTVAFQWGSNNKYIDVTLSLSKKAKLSKISLYDGPGSFTDQPDSIYALNGSEKTLLGVFTGNAYNDWVDINVDTSIVATAIIIHKYGNNLPVKIKIFGYEVNEPVLAASVITFAELPVKTAGDAPFSLVASSTSTETPVIFQSSDPAVASVSNTSGNWMVTLHQEGSIIITASQVGSANFSPATSVSRTLIVNGSIPAQRIFIASITPSENTGQDYSPWLNDNLDSTVAFQWGNNSKYIDVTLSLSKKAKLSKISLYDGPGSFTDQPDSIYALNGLQKTLLGVFTGNAYNGWVDINVDTSVTATAIVINKYGNNLPVKIKIFGYEVNDPAITASVINFDELPAKTVGDAPFSLNASSTNIETPVTFQSSDPAVASVSNSTGNWMVTLLKEGSVSITAAQSGNANFTPAVSVSRTLIVNKLVTDSSNRIPVVSIVASENTGQDYSPWLNDNLDSTVAFKWGVNDKYVDITLLTDSLVKLSKISLYDGLGSFADLPDSIYILNGSQKTLIGTFDGSTYNNWIDININPSVVANGIVLRKFGNNFPQKIKLFGSVIHSADSAKRNSIINFPEISNKTTSDSSFNILISSSNSEQDLILQSSDSTIVKISHTAGIWKAIILKKGNVTITAHQTGNNNFIAAIPVTRTFSITSTNTEPVIEPPVVITSPKIPLDPKRWYVLNNNTHLKQLFDGIITDNISITDPGALLPRFDSYYPLRSGEELSIAAIRFYDGNGMDTVNTFNLSIINAAWERIPVASFNGKKYQQWVGPYPDRPNALYLDSVITGARYLVITSGGAYPTEVELYGTYQAGTIPSIAEKKPTRLRELFEINAFEWDFLDAPAIEINPVKVNAMKSFTGIRHYIDWQKLEATEGKYTYNPTNDGGWDFDSMYETCKANNIDVLACIKGLPNWMKTTYPLPPAGEEDWRAEYTPLKFGNHPDSVKSYIEQAKMGFQFAARYGSNKNINPALVTVSTTQRWTNDPINVPKIGMGLIKYIECDNERDKSWRGVYGYQTARQYAANLSAYYDGHKNTLGPGVGVKNADPNMTVVMMGMATDKTDYLRGMVDWCKEFRGYNADGTVNICWDVINYHQYSNDAQSNQGGGSTRGAAPELGGLIKVARDFVQTSHEISNNKEIWVTELGYDIHPGSPLNAIPIGDKSAELVQADWLLRSSLLFAREGISRCFFYITYDHIDMASQWAGNVFGTSGLLRGSDYSRKPAADYLYQANKLFGQYRYKETLNSDPYVDRFELNGKSIYSLVVPDEKDRKVNYTLNLSGADSAYVYTPKAASDTMTVTKVKLTDGALSLVVTETPVFVVGIEGPREHNMFTWTGAVSTATDVKENWKNTVTGLTTQSPDEESVVLIPSGLSRYPVMSALLNVKDITIDSAATLDLNGLNLTVTGNFTNHGKLLCSDKSSSSVTFGGTDTTQVFTGNAVKGSTATAKLYVNNPNGLVLNGGPFDIYNFVKLDKGNLTSNGNLTLKSNAESFASIASLPQGLAVIGDVNVEVYFSGGYRSTRLISTPINDNTASRNSYLQLKDFTIITGLGGAANGFDPGNRANPNSPSMKKYNETPPDNLYQFSDVMSIYEHLLPGNGVYIFYRGDRSGYTPETSFTSSKTNAPFTVAESQTVTYKGPINQGQLTPQLSYNYHQGSSNNGYNLVGNPYPCTIDWKLVSKNLLEDFISLYKPDGGYATYSNGVASNAGQADMRYIQPGQGFFIKAHTTSSSITFTETCKVTEKTVGRFLSTPTNESQFGLDGINPKADAGQKTNSPELLRVSLNNSKTSEETVIAFSKSFKKIYSGKDGDASYLSDNIIGLSSLTEDEKEMTINFWPEFSKEDKIKLNVTSDVSEKLTLSFTQVPVIQNFNFVLNDTYLHTTTEIKEGITYPFSIDKNDSLTYGTARFFISSVPVSKRDSVSLRDEVPTTNITVFPNPASNQLTVETASEGKNHHISIYDLDGNLLKSKGQFNTQKTVFDVGDFAPGIYVITVKDLKSNKVISKTKFIKN